MSDVRETPMAGVVRVVYSLATALAAVFVVVMAITAFYDPPQPEFADSFDGGFGFTPSSESENYNRNISIIMMLVSAPLFAVGLALASEYNSFRAALILGGGILLSTGLGYAGSGSDQWIGFLLVVVNLLVLIGGVYYLESGVLLRRTRGVLHPAFADTAPADSPPPEDTPRMQE